MIIPLFKPIGASSHQLAQKAGELYCEKATHTGTLDPIASGVLTVLTGKDRFFKEKYADVKKIYRCKVLLGFSTDTHDILGLIQDTQEVSDAGVAAWTEQIPQLIGNHLQKMPHFSAKRHQGKSFFNFAKTGQSQDLPDIEVAITISAARMEGAEIFSSRQVLAFISRTISSVKGDFRQKGIASGWKKSLATHSQALTLTLHITCTKRTYIRSLVRDLSSKTGLPGCVLSLERVANGDFTIADCICLI